MPQQTVQEPRSLLVTRLPLSALQLDPANARTHGEQNLAAITASLQRFGQAEPLVVHARTGRVIGGNGRLVAMQELGWKECDVVQLELSDIEATALGIALNRTAELAEWDPEALANLLTQLRTDGSLEGVGYSSPDIDELLAEIAAGASSPSGNQDPGPEEPPVYPICARGELWRLGEHRLLCGDSTNADDVARVLAGEQATLLSTDPPYCVNYTGKDRPVHDGKPSGKDWTHVYREIDIADLGEFLDKVMAACLPHLEHRTPLYVWHAHVQQPHHPASTIWTELALGAGRRRMLAISGLEKVALTRTGFRTVLPRPNQHRVIQKDLRSRSGSWRPRLMRAPFRRR